MGYSYQELIREKISKSFEFAQKVELLREKRRKVVGRKIGMEVVGEVEIGRPTLGGADFVKNFRMLRMVGLRWNLSSLIGKKASNGVVYSIGVRLGRDFVSGGLIKGKDAKEFMDNFIKFVMNMKVGIISIIEWRKDFPNLIRVDECISCAGMLNIGEAICQYEGGIIGGVISEYFKGLIIAEEVLCWGHGEETCQFKLYAR
jgi:hypothetical protein